MRFVSGRAEPPEDVDIDRLREALAVEAVSFAVLFGSQATDDASPLSDLDVALRFKDEIPDARRFELLDELTVAVINATGIEAVDLIDLDAVGPRFGYEVLATGTLLFGDRSAAIELETELLLRTLDFQPVKRAWDEALEERIKGGTYGRP